MQPCKLLKRIKGTLQSVKLKGYKSFPLGSTRDVNQFHLLWCKWKWQKMQWRSKSRTTPKKGMVLLVVATDSCSLLILPDWFFSSFVFCQCPCQPNQVAQVVQLLQDGTCPVLINNRFRCQSFFLCLPPCFLVLASFGVNFFYEPIHLKVKNLKFYNTHPERRVISRPASTILPRAWDNLSSILPLW